MKKFIVDVLPGEVFDIEHNGECAPFLKLKEHHYVNLSTYQYYDALPPKQEVEVIGTVAIAVDDY
jgi:hypothetical protein